MPDITEVHNLLQDVSAKLAAMPNLTEDQVSELAKKAAESVVADTETARKMRFSTPDESLQGTKFGAAGMKAADIAFLHDLQTSLIGQRKADGNGVYSGPSEQLQNAFKAVNGGVVKAMDSAESGFGSQLIGAQYVGQLWEAARSQSRIFPLVNSMEMLHPTVYLPVEVDFPEMIFVSESTTNNASNYDTAKTGSNRVSVAAKKFLIHQMWSGEMEEDSIIPFLPFLQRQAGLAIGFHMDSLILNGDTTNAGTGNINLDDADPADTKHYLAFDGLRHAGLVDNTANSLDVAGALTYKQLMGQRSRMISTTYKHDWGHPNDPNSLVYVTDPVTADRIAELDEVLTADKYGSGATIMTGELAKIGRHALISTLAMSLTEADGKVSTTGGNNTKGQVVCFNRQGLVWGWRRQVKVETERLPGTDQTRLVYSLRGGLGRFTPTGAASGIEFADVLYNVTI
jgi:HK97 family phage major capsid protein